MKFYGFARQQLAKHGPKLPAGALALFGAFSTQPLQAEIQVQKNWIEYNESAPVSPLSIETLLKQVNDANLDLLAAERQVSAATTLATTAGRLDDPKLSLGAAPNTFDSTLGARYKFGLSQRLPWPGKLAIESEIGELNTQKSQQQRHSVARHIALDSVKAWANWWYLAQAISINQRSLDSYQLLVEAASSRYQSGRGKRQDTLQSQLRKLHTEHEQLSLIQEQQRIAQQLNRLRNRPPNKPVAPASGLPRLPHELDHRVLSAQLNQHPRYQLAKLNARVAAANKRQAELARLPDFIASTQYLGALDPAEKRWQVGLSINLPFDQRRRTQTIAATAERVSALQKSAQSEQLALQQQLASLLSSYQEHGQITALYAVDLLEIAYQNQQAAQQDYANGISDFDAVTSAITSYQQTEQTLAQHRANRLIALAQIQQLVGIPWAELIQPNANHINRETQSLRSTKFRTE